VLGHRVLGWRRPAAPACDAPPQVRQAQLACPRRVLGRFDTLRRGFRPGGPRLPRRRSRLSSSSRRSSGSPRPADVPRLTLAPTPAGDRGLRAVRPEPDDNKPSDSRDPRGCRAGPPRIPCARAIAALAFDDASWERGATRRVMSRAVSSVDQCGRRAAARGAADPSALTCATSRVSGDQPTPPRGRQRSPRPG